MDKSNDNATPWWTVEDITARLGISVAIFQKHPIGARDIAEIRKAGITRIELSCIPRRLDYRNHRQVKEIMSECQKQGVTIVSMHGPFNLPYNAVDEETRKAVVSESLSAIQFAEEIGATIYIAHFGYREHTRKTVSELLKMTGGFCVKLTTENGKYLRNYMVVVDDIGSDRFGLTVDIGHARDDDGINPFVKEEKARHTLAQCGARVFHVHLHDIFDVPRNSDHSPPLHSDGIVQWGEIFAGLKDIGYQGELVFEDGRGENPEEWLQMTATFPKRFVQRYGIDIKTKSTTPPDSGNQEGLAGIIRKPQVRPAPFTLLLKEKLPVASHPGMCFQSRLEQTGKVFCFGHGSVAYS